MDEIVKYEVTNVFVKQTLKTVGNALLGRILHRVEDFVKLPSTEQEALKLQIKNVLHENLRDIEQLLSSFDKGVKFNLENSSR